MIINKDCLEALKELPDNSIDAIVTDPPYHLVSVTKRFGGKNAHNTPAMETEEGGVFARKAKGFMGKDWDGVDETGLGIAQKVELWEECLRVLKPGGYLLAFSGTRTTHRMTVAIEDAGFEIRDMIAWVYGSGFPKSLNIGKAVDKLQGNEREEIWHDRYKDGKTRQNLGTAHMVCNALAPIANGNITTKGTSEWEGWGTALKPALEPITVARKPIEGTVAENCLKWGVGGINIDGCRVETSDDISIHKGAVGFEGSIGSITKESFKSNSQNLGRFPANLIHDGSEEVVGGFPDSKAGGSIKAHKRDKSSINFAEYHQEWDGFNDSGSAARFFYCAKASKRERNIGCEGLETSQKFTAGNYSQSPTCKDCNLTLNGTNDHSKCSGEVYYKEMENKNTKNNHPTVKPIKLMEYLVNLVSKEGHTVLDPFAGSGTTGIACKKLNRNFIGIERDEEYCKIAEARIESVSQNNTLFV